MRIAGIIAEYNPFHNGHAWQIEQLRQRGFDAVVCVCSPGVVQRGEPAMLPTYVRTTAALAGGADLVLSLPAPYAVLSSEGFAAAGVALLTALGCVDTLCFGVETGRTEDFIRLAEVLEGEDFSLQLHKKLGAGLPLPAARAAAAGQLCPGADALLHQGNTILGVDYCRAILRQKSSLVPLALPRMGTAHDAPLEAAETAETAGPAETVKTAGPAETVKTAGAAEAAETAKTVKTAGAAEAAGAAETVKTAGAAEAAETAKTVKTAGAAEAAGAAETVKTAGAAEAAEAAETVKTAGAAEAAGAAETVKTAGAAEAAETAERASASQPEHRDVPSKKYASASALRALARRYDAITLAPYVPSACADIYYEAETVGAWLWEGAFCTAALSRLRMLSAQQLREVRGAAEGLENRLAAAIELAGTWDGLIDAMKTKRYATARLRRFALNAVLGYNTTTLRHIPALPPYLHVLGATEAGRAVLGIARKTARLPLSHSLALLAKAGTQAAAVAAAHAAAEDFTALCLRRPAPMGTAYTIKAQFL